MTGQTLFGVFVVPAIIGLVEVLKNLGVPTRVAPAISVALGILAAMAQYVSGQWPWVQAVVVGIALGLSACGLYAGVKTVLPIGGASATPDVQTTGPVVQTPAPVAPAAAAHPAAPAPVAPTPVKRPRVRKLTPPPAPPAPTEQTPAAPPAPTDPAS